MPFNRKTILLLFLFFLLVLLPTRIFASSCNEGDPELDRICRELEKLNEEKDSLQKAIVGAELSLSGLNSRLNSIRSNIKLLTKQLESVEKEIINREADRQVQEKVLSAKIRGLYKRTQQASPLLILLSRQSAASFAREYSYWISVANQDRELINNFTAKLKKLQSDRSSFEKNKKSLTQLASSLEKDAAKIKTDIQGAKQYQGEVGQKIAQLTAKQQAILSARTGTFTTSVGEVPISNIPCSGPPGSPSFCDPGSGDWFAAFSFGAWTHRKGMSQYGAKGRAQAGQNYREILKAYYNQEPVNKDTGGTIGVVGFGNLDFENYYLLGIAEMPSDWPMEALKAQAIAARSYAYRYKIDGRSICTTQACQVFSSSKAGSPPGPWKQAVEETRGQVVENVTAFYSSTAGGYLTYPSGKWDTTDGQGGSGFASRSWESKAGSPWFYASWYTSNYTASSATCGRSHPWLNSQELADILNAWIVITKESGNDRILPETINQCSLGGTTGNPYSKDELRQKSASLGGGYSQVSSVSVVYGDNGATNSLNFATDKGNISLSGSEFKQAFNLRAPGYIAIRSPLFNLEKK